jgi:GT2 family glycosyltransferase
VIIVTYNSQLHLPKALECLADQTHPPGQIILVDTGSTDRSYLSRYENRPEIQIVFAEKNAGYCKGNNIGMTCVAKECDYVFLLNPDAFLTKNYLEKAIAFMQDRNQQRCGAVTGVTLGYDIKADHPTGKYDTTGIFRTWYGRWFDRYQGKEYQPSLFSKSEELPAICGAVFFCRKKALDAIRLEEEQIFDSTFYMYKEDIDLSIRLRKKGWSLFFVPELVAYHCRGWNSDRSKMPRQMRVCSARNELRIQVRLLSFIGIVYSAVKYFAVKVFNL